MNKFNNFFFSTKFAVILAIIWLCFEMYNDGIHTFGDGLYYVLIFPLYVLMCRCLPYIVCFVFGAVLAIVHLVFSWIGMIFNIK